MANTNSPNKSNSEITNRGIFIGLIVVILGGAAKLFGFMGNP